MFDIAFSEIALIAVVALVVIGPERLPKVARTLGHMFGRLQRYVNDVKADINREIELDELRHITGRRRGEAGHHHRAQGRHVEVAAPRQVGRDEPLDLAPELVGIADQTRIERRHDCATSPIGLDEALAFEDQQGLSNRRARDRQSISQLFLRDPRAGRQRSREDRFPNFGEDRFRHGRLPFDPPHHHAEILDPEFRRVKQSEV
jgi:Tat protein translocase TatB subunit